MKPKWLIEDVSLEDNFDDMIKAITSQGMEYKMISESWDKYRKQDFLDLYESKDCVIYHGSLQTGAIIRRKASWVPGIYADMEKYLCTSYYPAFGEDLLNEEYVMLPFGELNRRKEWLYDKIGIDRAIFIRPNKGSKIFTGKLIYKENWDKDIEYLGFYKVDDNELCVVCRPYNIVDEYRFIVVNENIISGSTYRINGNVGTKEIHHSEEPWIYAQEMIDVARYYPEKVFVFDTCKTKGGQHKVMEVGCFSCAGLYKNNMDEVIRQVSRVALNEWEEIYVGT